MKALDKSYFELARHSFLQNLIYLLISVAGVVIVFVLLLPVLKEFFQTFLQGFVHDGGNELAYSLNSNQKPTETSYLTSWAIDINIGTAEESRFWFKPVLALLIPSLIIGSGLAVLLTSILPTSLGLFRQKIEREVINMIDKIGVLKYGYFTDEDRNEIFDQIKNATLKELHELSAEIGFPIDDLKTLHRGINWMESSFPRNLLRINDGMRMYMRFHFTIRYSNAILGLVYIGAAVLIIIIGLRGLKFIPASQPSYVLFALGLEFTLLLTYAFTVMYSKRDDEIERDKRMSVNTTPDNLLLRSDFGDSRDVEKLLRVFVNIDRNKFKQRRIDNS